MQNDFLQGIVSKLKGYFGGSSTTPDQKVNDQGSLFSRLFNGAAPQQNPNNQPPMLSPIPPQNVLGASTAQPSPTPQPSAPPPTLAATLMPTPQLTPQPTHSVIPGFHGATPSASIVDLVNGAAQKQNINPALLAALLFQESRFSPTATNNNGTSLDRGMAMINNVYHPEVSDQQAFDPSFAIPFAAQMLGNNIQHFGGNVNRGVAAYNVGQGGANINGPAPFGGGPHAQSYLDAVGRYIDPSLLAQLGFITSP